jgi:hypothetical protein
MERVARGTTRLSDGKKTGAKNTKDNETEREEEKQRREEKRGRSESGLIRGGKSLLQGPGEAFPTG